MASYDDEKFGSTFQSLAARFKQHANKTNDRLQETASQAAQDELRREPEQGTKHPRQADASNKAEMDIHATKFTANKLQFLANYKLRVESAKNEPGLRHLLGHISIYDAVRDWRQAEARAGIEMIEASMKKVSCTEKASSSSPLRALAEEEETESPSSSTTSTSGSPAAISEPTTPHHLPYHQSFSDFQAALQRQIDSLKQIRDAHIQLQRQNVVDPSDLESESETATESDYDSSDDMSWPGDDEIISDVESDCSIMPDLELVKYVTSTSTSTAWREDDDSGQLGLGLARELKFVKIDMRVR
ncbi:hypothetical protein DV738_g3161, partial [Chaetothyriales sp. CBS 135597]